MKLTKYGHGCFVLEEQDQKLVIDPGAFTPEFGSLENIVAVVVTHQHPDHFNPEYLKTIVAVNRDVVIFTPGDIISLFSDEHAHAVQPGLKVSAGPFNLQFSGEMHELIHDTLPRPQNTAVLVNNVFFDPGDSYTLPEKPVPVLAVPANAPWMKVADSMDYITAVKPKQCVPTHNGLLSEHGHMVYNGALQRAAEAAGVTFTYLKPGESIEI